MSLVLAILAATLCIGFAALLSAVIGAPEAGEGECGFELTSEVVPTFKSAGLLESTNGYGLRCSSRIGRNSTAATR
jgi:hypothetical protein